MCIPCWPWADVYIEDEPKRKKTEVGYIVYDHIAKIPVRIVDGPVVSPAFSFFWPTLWVCVVFWGNLPKWEVPLCLKYLANSLQGWRPMTRSRPLLLNNDVSPILSQPQHQQTTSTQQLHLVDFRTTT
jgi:hypothetical protein